MVTGGSAVNGLRKKIEKNDKIPTVQVIFIATRKSHST